jgi:hypothetical protein
MGAHAFQAPLAYHLMIRKPSGTHYFAVLLIMNQQQLHSREFTPYQPSMQPSPRTTGDNLPITDEQLLQTRMEALCVTNPEPPTGDSPCPPGATGIPPDDPQAFRNALFTCTYADFASYVLDGAVLSLDNGLGALMGEYELGEGEPEWISICFDRGAILGRNISGNDAGLSSFLQSPRAARAGSNR